MHNDSYTLDKWPDCVVSSQEVPQASAGFSAVSCFLAEALNLDKESQEEGPGPGKMKFKISWAWMKALAFIMGEFPQCPQASTLQGQLSPEDKCLYYSLLLKLFAR